MRRWIGDLESGPVTIATLVIIAIISLFHHSFLSFTQLSNTIEQNSFVAILACGMAFLIAMRELDLSVGSMLGLTVICAAVLQGHGLNPWLTAVIALGIGALLGGFNAVLVQGIVIVITLTVLLRLTPFGYRVRSIGSNPQAASHSGISLPRMRVTALILMGVLCAVGVPRSRRAAVAAGVALVSGDRRGVGLMLDKPLWENIAQVRSIALRRDGRLIRRRALRRRAQEQTRRLDVRARSVDSLAGSLSGGNQQKVVFAKWLELEPQVLLLDDPTRGVDIGAKGEMHRLIRAIADGGAVVVLCSTDNQELAELCDRVAVFYQGTMVGELTRLDEHVLLEAVNTGLVQEAA